LITPCTGEARRAVLSTSVRDPFAGEALQPHKTVPGPDQPQNADSYRFWRRRTMLARGRRFARPKQPPTSPQTRQAIRTVARLGGVSHPRLAAEVTALQAALPRPRRRLRRLQRHELRLLHWKARASSTRTHQSSPTLLGPLHAGLARFHHPLRGGGEPSHSDYLGQSHCACQGAPAPTQTCPRTCPTPKRRFSQILAAPTHASPGEVLRHAEAASRPPWVTLGPRSTAVRGRVAPPGCRGPGGGGCCAPLSAAPEWGRIVS